MELTIYGKMEILYGGQVKIQKGRTIHTILRYQKEKNQRIDSARNPAETEKDLQLMLAKDKQLIIYTSEEQ